MTPSKDLRSTCDNEEFGELPNDTSAWTMAASGVFLVPGVFIFCGTQDYVEWAVPTRLYGNTGALAVSWARVFLLSCLQY